MAKAKLDKSRDYAEVIGRPGVVYEQDHKQFDGQGNEVNYVDPEPVTDKFTDMTRDDMIKYLEDNKVTVDEAVSDDDLRVECREVFI